VQSQIASSVPAASETVAGRVELATAAETATGTDGVRAVHPAGLKPLLDAKAPLASPTFTGNPAAPTPAQFDADTSLATTQFVQRAAGNYSTVTVETVNRTLTAADVGRYLFCNANNIDLTLPDPSTLPTGSVITVVQSGTTSGARVLAPAGVTLNGVMDGSATVGGNMPLTNRALYEFVVVSTLSYQATSYGGANSLVQSGYQRLPSGLIVQWGTLVSTSNSTPVSSSASLPIAFPNAALAVIGSRLINLSTNNSVTYDQIFTLSLTQVTVTNVQNTGTVSNTYNYVAIGR
jgi:hypothetical protein